ncbi:MAG: transposase [Mycoplasmataceae bacterium CE_OT135]|nr:MAG: transposase [Mycoplasmataceae bacterium CE_OT135]
MKKAEFKKIKPPTPQHLNSLKQQGYTYKTIATVYGVSERTVRNWKKENNKPKQKRGRKSKLCSKLFIELLCFLKFDGKSSTQQEIADYISKKMKQKVSRFAIHRILKKLGVTRKKMTNHYSEQLKHTKQIRKFKKIMPRLSQSHFFALDECSFHLNEVPRYGYSHKGSRVHYKKLGRQGNNHTLILCIQNIENKGIIHYELIQEGMKTESFHNFLTNLKLPFSTRKQCLLMDNLPVHKARKSCLDLKLTPIKELLESKRIKPIYLPPYTPELNPAELCFNFIRQKVEKNKPRTYEELKLEIDKIIGILNEKDLTQYFRHSSDYDFSERKDSSFMKLCNRWDVIRLESGNLIRNL